VGDLCKCRENLGDLCTKEDEDIRATLPDSWEVSIFHS
jgi:hypothetical protein